MLDVDMDDFDFLKGSRSRLRMGVELSRGEMLRLALMSSENRAASALARHYPGGADAFVAAMNEKARSLGMTRTRFDDATGLSPKNVSTASDLALLVSAAARVPADPRVFDDAGALCRGAAHPAASSASTIRTGSC